MKKRLGCRVFNWTLVAPAREIEGCLWVKHPEALSGISQPTIEIITLLRKAGCF